MEIKTLLILLILLAPSVSAYEYMTYHHPMLYAQAPEQKMYWGPDMDSIFNPEGKTFCHEYKLGSEFPIAEYFGQDVAAVYHADYDRELNYWTRGTHTVNGMVDIRRGSCQGKILGTYEFESEFYWEEFEQRGMVDWWSPYVHELRFKLEIKKVGTFTVERRGDIWKWTGLAFTMPRTYTHDFWTENFINANPYR